MDENWAALYLAIVDKKHSVDQALSMIRNGRCRETGKLSHNTKEAMAAMKRAGYTWQEIGSAYGLSMQAAQKTVKRHREQKEEDKCT